MPNTFHQGLHYLLLKIKQSSGTKIHNYIGQIHGQSHMYGTIHQLESMDNPI